MIFRCTTCCLCSEEGFTPALKGCSVHLNDYRSNNRHGMLQLVKNELFTYIMRAPCAGPEIPIISHSHLCKQQVVERQDMASSRTEQQSKQELIMHTFLHDGSMLGCYMAQKPATCSLKFAHTCTLIWVILRGCAVSRFHQIAVSDAGKYVRRQCWGLQGILQDRTTRIGE